MKTNVSIKFNSIEEYREIEKVLEGLGYWSEREWNKNKLKKVTKAYVKIHIDKSFCIIDNRGYLEFFDLYNSLEEFLKDK